MLLLLSFMWLFRKRSEVLWDAYHRYKKEISCLFFQLLPGGFAAAAVRRPTIRTGSRAYSH